MYLRAHPLQVQARGVGRVLYLGGHHLCGIHSLHIRPALLQRGSVHRCGTCSKCFLRRRFVPPLAKLQLSSVVCRETARERRGDAVVEWASKTRRMSCGEGKPAFVKPPCTKPLLCSTYTMHKGRKSSGCASLGGRVEVVRHFWSTEDSVGRAQDSAASCRVRLAVPVVAVSVLQVLVLSTQGGLLLKLQPFLDEHSWKLPVKLLTVCEGTDRLLPCLGCPRCYLVTISGGSARCLRHR